MRKGLFPISLFLLIFLLSGANFLTLAAEEKTGRTIPYPPGYDLTSEGASAYAGSTDHPDSRYFAHLDVYNLTSDATLTIIPHFATYQQTTESTCGPASALMVLYHFGNTDWDELAIAEIMGTSQDLDGDNWENPGEANERGEWGTSTSGMVKFFEEIGWQVTSSLTEGRLEDGRTFAGQDEFTPWVLANLKQGIPIMVEWIDWLGHWQVIIGYDTMGTETLGDDVLILADPYDTSDHLQDGYYFFNAERFFYMWADAFILPETQMYQQWVIATPPGY
ncbi:MAG TPA: C39 family peptidase [Capillibacterium sp.]